MVSGLANPCRVTFNESQSQLFIITCTRFIFSYCGEMTDGETRNWMTKAPQLLAFLGFSHDVCSRFLLLLRLPPYCLAVTLLVAVTIDFRQSQSPDNRKKTKLPCSEYLLNVKEDWLYVEIQFSEHYKSDWYRFCIVMLSLHRFGAFGRLVGSRAYSHTLVTRYKDIKQCHWSNSKQQVVIKLLHFIS